MIIGIIKPPGITSHDVVNGVRRITGERRVGHGGTLDPFASGVLVIGISRESTRKLQEILKDTDKEYVAVIEAGKTSTTGDPEGEITEHSGPLSLEEGRVEEVLKGFIGEIEQTPPSHSAIKVNGVPAYRLARRGEKIRLKKRKVFIKELELLEFNPPFIKIRTVVSSGTYIRSLAEDIGKKLGVGAYLKELTRTRVGDFTIDDSKTIEDLANEIKLKRK